MKTAYIWLVLALSYGWQYVRNDPTPYHLMSARMMSQWEFDNGAAYNGAFELFSITAVTLLKLVILSSRNDGNWAKCGYGKVCKRNVGFATIPWDSPLESHDMKVICPMQDMYLKKADLSSVFIPHWIKSNVDPVGRCPVRLQKVDDGLRLWPSNLISVECACEHSRCTMRGTHTCSTIYVSRPTLRSRGFTKELLAVDCVCANQRAHLAPPITLPRIVN